MQVIVLSITFSVLDFIDKYNFFHICVNFVPVHNALMNDLPIYPPKSSSRQILRDSTNAPSCKLENHDFEFSSIKLYYLA